MDHVKIGKFIAACRKQKNLTQLQLAEKLHVTDRAISKWETGKAMPDSSIMLALCAALGITVNDLLSGEVVTTGNYVKELESKLLDMIKQKEENDRYLLTLEWVIGILSCLILFVPAFIGALLPLEEWLRVVITCSGLIPCMIGVCFAVKIEQIAGYYACSHCGNRYVPGYKAVNLAPHIGRTRYLCCPKCRQKSWQKKVLTQK